jgi:uncharacterized protein
MKRIAGILLGLFALLLFIYAGASWYFSGKVIERGTTPIAVSAANQSGPEAYGLPLPEPISIEHDGVTLEGWYFANEMGGDCGVVLLHGSTGNRFGVLQYTPLFWERGCDLLLYDARGHGDSTPSFHTYGYHEKEDLRAVVAWMQERTGLPLSQIGLAGVSYGAATVLQAAPLLPEVAFVLADSAYQDLTSIVSYQGVAQFGEWIGLFVPGALTVADWRAGMSHTAVSPTNAIAQTPQIPIFLLHSQQDEFTPPQHSQTIYNNSNPDNTVLYLVDWGAPHGRAILTRPDEYAELFENFMQTYAPEFGLTAVGP